MNQSEDAQVQVLACIGHICLQWALLEAVAAQIIWALIPVEHEMGAILFGGLDLQPRLNAALALGHYKRAPGVAIHKLLDVRKAVQGGLADRRNQAVHGIHSEGNEEGAVTLTMLRWKGPKRQQTLAVETLHQISQDIIQVRNLAYEALELIWKWQLDSSPAK